MRESKKSTNTYKADFHKSRHQDGYREHRYKTSFVRGESAKVVLPDETEQIQSYKFCTANDEKFGKESIDARRKINDCSETRNTVPDLLKTKKSKHKIKSKSKLHEQTGTIMKYDEDDGILNNYDSENLTRKSLPKSSSNKIHSSEKNRKVSTHISRNQYDTFDCVKKSETKKYVHSKQNSKHDHVLEHLELDFNLHSNDETKYKRKHHESHDESAQTPSTDFKNVMVTNLDYQENSVKSSDAIRYSMDESSTTDRIAYLNQNQNEETAFSNSNKALNSCIFNSWTELKKNGPKSNNAGLRRLSKMEEQIINNNYFENVLMIKDSHAYRNDLKGHGLYGMKIFPAETIKVTENSWPPVIFSENPKIFVEKLGRNVLTVVTPDRKQIMDDICNADNIK